LGFQQFLDKTGFQLSNKRKLQEKDTTCIVLKRQPPMLRLLFFVAPIKYENVPSHLNQSRTSLLSRLSSDSLRSIFLLQRAGQNSNFHHPLLPQLFVNLTRQLRR
jgi:hypothetical protein